MRIALIVEKFDEFEGGVERAVWELARWLRENGDEVHVIARAGKNQDGITLHRVLVSRFWQPLRVWSFSKAVGTVVRNNAFDIVHGFCKTQSLDVFHAGGGSHHSYLQHAYGHTGSRLRTFSPRHWLQLRLESQIAKGPQPIIQCVSEMGRREFQDIYDLDDSRLVVIPCGVDPQIFTPAHSSPVRQEIREELHAVDATVWLLPGSGFNRKGVLTAMKALAQTKDASARLWVAGKDDPTPWIRRARKLGVDRKVQFLGRRSDMSQVYAGADGVLLPTRYDGFGLACLEAASSGLPLITSAQCGAAELLSGAGVVIPDANNAKAFAAALDRFSKPEERQKAGDAGRQIAEENSWAHSASNLRSLYVKILKSRDPTESTATLTSSS